MIEQIINDPELVKNLILLAASLPLIPISNWISKKVPDYTGESEETK